MTAPELQAAIETALPQSRVEVRDTTGGGDHFEAVVIAPAFAGATRIEQHRMVYAALGDRMAGAVHALALRTFTPEQWEQSRQAPR